MVTNVTAFGAFVDIGVHQDGLVHVSQLADRFIKDPSEAVKVGDKLKVRVLEVDLERKRISLTAKKGGGQAPAGPRPPQGNAPQQGRPQGRPDQRPGQGQQGRGAPPKQGEGFKNNPFATHFKK